MRSWTIEILTYWYYQSKIILKTKISMSFWILVHTISTNLGTIIGVKTIKILMDPNIICTIFLLNHITKQIKDFSYLRLAVDIQQLLSQKSNECGWEDLMEKDVATYSSILACGIPWTEEPGGLQSMGLQRVGHD